MFTIALSALPLLTSGYTLGRFCSRSRCRRLRTALTTARHLAEHDPLTGLLNRTGAQSFYESQAASSIVVLVDLDGFKTVNDTWGHQVGDAQLVAIAQRLTDACAPIDAVAGRLSGDEFLLLLPETEPAAARAQVAAILAQLSTPITHSVVDALVNITPSASAGIAVPQGGQAWASQLRHADIALYQAKAVGGQAVLYATGMQQPARQDSRETRLRDSDLVNFA